jgi:hypothetical protein
MVALELRQVTVVPFGTVSVAGSNLSASVMFTVGLTTGAAALAAPGVLAAAAEFPPELEVGDAADELGEAQAADPVKARSATNTPMRSRKDGRRDQFMSRIPVCLCSVGNDSIRPHNFSTFCPRTQWQA